MPLQYVGRLPDSDSTVVPKSSADALSAELAVTTAYVNAQAALVAEGLTTKAYVDAQDALLATQAQVIAADAAYVPLTKLGVANGVASLDSSGNLTASQVPTSLLTDRTIQSQTCSGAGILLVPGASHTVSTTSPREYQLGTIEVADPGFPWRPLPFAWVQGGDLNATAPPTQQAGTGNFGLLSVMPPQGVSDIVYGVGLCTDSYLPDTYLVTPYAGAGQTPSQAPAIVGSMELDLFGCVASGSEYTYLGNGFVYFIQIVPSL
jgi:hypothetical protein